MLFRHAGQVLKDCRFEAVDILIAKKSVFKFGIVLKDTHNLLQRLFRRPRGLLLGFAAKDGKGIQIQDGLKDNVGHHTLAGCRHSELLNCILEEKVLTITILLGKARFLVGSDKIGLSGCRLLFR